MHNDLQYTLRKSGVGRQRAVQSTLAGNHNRVLFVAFTIVVFVTPFLVQITSSSLMKLLEDAAYLIMLIYSLYLLSRRTELSARISKTVALLVLSVLVFTMIGIYYSGVAMVILQYREFKYLLLLIILLPFKEDDFKYIWPTMKVFAAICIPVAIGQWVILQGQGDFITGIMGYKESGTLTAFLLIIFFSELTLRLRDGKRILGYYFLYLIPTALNETKITLFLLPLMFIASLMVSRRFNIKYFFYVSIVTVILVAGWGYLYNTTAASEGGAANYQQSAFSILSLDVLKEYLFASDWEVDSGRMTKVLLALDIVKEQPLFGFGLGASYGGATSGINGFIYSQYNTATQLAGTRVQLALSIVDLGLLGVCVVLFILGVTLVKVMKCRPLTLNKIAAVNSMIIVLTGIPYNDVFYNRRIMFILVVFSFLALRFNKKTEMNR